MSRSLAELREYLVGEWLFQNDFQDTSGNGNHGIPTDVEWVPTERGMKPFGGKVSFGEMVSKDVFTISMWMNAKYWPDDYSSLFALSNTSGGWPNDTEEAWCIMNYWIGNDIVFAIGDDSAYESTPIINNDIPTNEWLNIIVSCNVAQDIISTYVNGVLVESGDCGGITSISKSPVDLYIGNYLPMFYDDAKYYGDVAFTHSEALALYNSTKHAYGVQPAERSFSHDVGAVLGSPEGAVFTTDMHTKNADGTLIDLSGNSNHGTIVGCGRAGGYFRDGMSFDGINDNVASTTEIPTTDFRIDMLIKPDVIYDSVFRSIVSQYTSGYAGRFHFSIYNGNFNCRIGEDRILPILPLAYENKFYVISIEHHDRMFKTYHNGVLTAEFENPEDIMQNAIMVIGGWIGNYRYVGAFNFINVEQYTDKTIDVFNSLAVLPLYQLDCSKLPANTTVFTDFLPYCSAVINSGSFKITESDHGNQIVCVSSGQIVLQNAHAFDGDEYLTLTVDGETYSGTGTITQGTVTASISQDSTAITVNMAAGDVLDKLDIQFRRPV